MSDKRLNTILRVAYRHKPYSQLSNAMLRDKRLDYQQRGLLSFILSQHPDFPFTMKWLIEDVGGIGRDAAYEAMKVYMAAGYCVRRAIKEKQGRITAWEYVFTDDPDPLPEKPEVEPLPDPPEVVAATSCNSGSSFKNKSRDKNNKKEVAVERLSFDGSQLQLHGELLAFWLAKFGGDAERLDLALIAAIPYIQPNGNRPLEAQVSAQLARSAADKRDRDQRAGRGTTASPRASASLFDRKIEGARRCRQLMEQMETRGRADELPKIDG